jgi:hypothetical protein
MLILVAPCLLVGQKQTIVIFLCEKENIDLHWVGFFFFGNENKFRFSLYCLKDIYIYIYIYIYKLKSLEVLFC